MLYQMKQAKCLVWVKKNHMILGDHNHPATTKAMKRFNQQQSWVDQEEPALESVVWPPRSYACSFCKREFRSAQALGGHMNVHRRDRALLKQVNHAEHQPLPYSQPLDHLRGDHNRHTQDHHNKRFLSKSMAVPTPSQLCSPRTSTVPHLSPASRVYSSTGPRKFIGTNNDVFRVNNKISVGIDFATMGIYPKEEIMSASGGNEECLSSKRCKKTGDRHVRLFRFFDEVQCSNVKGFTDLHPSKSVEGLDLELRLGDATYKVQ